VRNDNDYEEDDDDLAFYPNEDDTVPINVDGE
jgi:hypothetical protein